MSTSHIVIAIIAGALIIGGALYFRPTEFDSCVKTYMENGSQRGFAASFCSRK